MVFTSPTPFREALQSIRAKEVLPTDLSSAELAALAPEIRERAFFSARTNNAGYLQQIQDMIARIVAPEVVKDPLTGQDRPRQPGEYMDLPTARLEMKTALAAMGYQPDPDQRGGLQDLSSDRRTELVIRMNTQLAQGFGAFEADQDPGRLEAFPAQELYRLEERRLPRDWPSRWDNARGELGDATSALDSRLGMIALKNDPIWVAISAFGLPYPPFDYASGMWVRDVSYSDAVALGLVASPEDVPDPSPRRLNDDLGASIVELAQPLQEVLKDSLGALAKFLET